MSNKQLRISSPTNAGSSYVLEFRSRARLGKRLTIDEARTRIEDGKPVFSRMHESTGVWTGFSFEKRRNPGHTRYDDLETFERTIQAWTQRK